jgi:tRNA-dependent cyclodipeptide synthase
MRSKNMTPNIYIIGMSPGNSYFKDDEVKYLLRTTVERYGKVVIFIADVPAISTYIAYGYPENRARRDKAIPQGNLLKNRVIRAMNQLGYNSETVRIIDWESEVEPNSDYALSYGKVKALYDSNADFRNDADGTTRHVLEGSKREFKNINESVKIGVHYLLSEIAFLEWSSKYFNTEKATYIYHTNWPVYENYIAGKYDGDVKEHMDFLLLENPWETYSSVWGSEDYENGKYSNVLERVNKTGILRVAFSNYPPALMYDRQYDNFSGIFYEVIINVARKNNWNIRWSEETGYGVIIDGLEKNRFDIFGSTVWPTPERKEKASFSSSLYESKVFPWIREDFKQLYSEMKDKSELRIAVKENDISHSIANADFKEQRLIYVPQLTDTSELLKFVAENKADVTFVEPHLASIFNQTSPIKLVSAEGNPVRTYENTFVFLKEDLSLKDIFDKEIENMKVSGLIEKLLKKYQFIES